MSAHHHLEDLSYREVQRILALGHHKVALVPAGSTEAHGPHLPLSTDTLISEAVAELAGARLAERGLESVQFPAIPYAVTEWARPFAGSTSISTEVATSLMLETLLAAKSMGFDRVVLTNAHLEPGHIATLRDVATQYQDRTREPLVFPDKTRRKLAERLTAEFQSGSCHAGQYETSLVLAIRPDLVDMDIARSLPEHIVPLHERIKGGAESFLDCGMDQAYCGNPAAATAEEGQQTLSVLADMVVEAVEASLSDT